MLRFCANIRKTSKTEKTRIKTIYGLGGLIF